MISLLAPLVGDASTISLVGLCKNAGKTTAMCRLIRELDGEKLAMTSVGRDGERKDIVTGTKKPEIWIPRGTLFATVQGLLPLCDTTVSVEAVTDAMTPLGVVAVFRALSDGYIQLAGPSAVPQLEPLSRTFRALGAQRVLIDGAAARRSLACVGEDGCVILCAGASMPGGVSAIAAETAHLCQLFASREPENAALRAALSNTRARFALFTPDGDSLPLEREENGQPRWGSLPRKRCVLWVAGGVTGSLLRILAQRGVPAAVAVPDATHFLQDRGATERFLRGGGRFLVRRRLAIAAVTANPWSAYGRHLDRRELLDALRAAVAVPVVDVRQENGGN
ncbi:MAG: hypothetical protein LKK00_04380 [Intestinimonas sp.]|jgi:hypothetical protein|nr:hypothetical protein [Intestinimonas sp.]